MKKILNVIAGLIFTTLVLQAQAQNKSLDKVAAVVGSAIILQSDIEMQYAQYRAQGNLENSDIKCYFLQQLLAQKLLSQQAAIDSITVSEGQVDDEVNRRMRVMTQRAGGEDRLEQFLNRSILQYKEEIRSDIKEQLIANKMQGKITENVNVTPLDVRRYFDAIPKDSLPSYGTEVEIGTLVTYPKLTKLEKEIFQDKLEALRLRIKAGEDFSTLARIYSQDIGSAREGGELGFAYRNAYVKEFAAMAFKLKVGELSPVFETQFGFHVLQVIEKRGEQVNVRHILIKIQPTPASLARIKVHIDSIYNSVVQKKIDFGKAVFTYSEDNETKYNGGMMLHAENVRNRTTYIPTDKLDPQLFLVVDTMQVNTYSKPVVFTSADGKQGYRFLYLKSKTHPHKANLEEDFSKIKEIALEDKISRTVSEWFEKRRKFTYVKIDAEYQDCSKLKGWTSTQN